jgi:phosphoglycerate dehydrogenase-like enzyme
VAVRRRANERATVIATDDESRSLGEVMLDRVGGPEFLPELLGASDFVVLAAPLTPATRFRQKVG